MKGRPTKNKEDTYLLHKTGYIYRWDKNTLAIYFTSTNAKNKYVSLLEQENVDICEFISGDNESVFHFPENQFNTVAKILKPQKKFKDNFPNFE
jgi:uncharacterized membrane protein